MPKSLAADRVQSVAASRCHRGRIWLSSPSFRGFAQPVKGLGNNPTTSGVGGLMRESQSSSIPQGRLAHIAGTT
jgi:hypothetical protein